ncbi:MAG: phosphotransferase family protein [Georgfuchsia sp.]
MDGVTEKILIAVKDFLGRAMSADALTGDWLTEAHMAVTALEHEIARERADEAFMLDAGEKERQLVDALKAIAGKTAVAALCGSVARKWTDTWSRHVGVDVSMTLAGILGTVDLSEDQYRAVTQKLKDYLIGYYAHFDPAIAAGTASTYKGGRRDDISHAAVERAVITAPGLEQYLNRRFPERGSAKLVEFRKLTGGYSKETYLAKTLDSGGERRIVLRKDGVGLPTGSTVVDEFDVIARARGAGVPAPEPLWMEPDESIFGTAVMAVGFIGGRTANACVPTEAAAKRKWAESFAECLARLHALRPADPELDLPTSLGRDLDAIERLIVERERQPHPGLILGIDWLKRNLHRMEGRPACLVHGDFGFHNIIIDEDRIAAVLDWEFCHFSDAAEDLIFVRPFVEQLVQWPDFMAMYKANGGKDYADDVVKFFDVWKEVRNAETCLGSLNSLLMPGVDDVKLAVAGCVFAPKFEVAGLDAILDRQGGMA